jgi:hypothetical protein
LPARFTLTWIHIDIITTSRAKRPTTIFGGWPILILELALALADRSGLGKAFIPRKIPRFFMR